MTKSRPTQEDTELFIPEEEASVKETDLITWVKESGVEIKTNSHPDNIAMAKSLGWKRK